MFEAHVVMFEEFRASSCMLREPLHWQGFWAGTWVHQAKISGTLGIPRVYSLDSHSHNLRLYPHEQTAQHQHLDQCWCVRADFRVNQQGFRGYGIGRRRGCGSLDPSTRDCRVAGESRKGSVIHAGTEGLREDDTRPGWPVRAIQSIRTRQLSDRSNRECLPGCHCGRRPR